MADMTPPSTSAANSEMMSISAKIMIVAVIVVFFMMTFLFIHLYPKWYWSRDEDPRIVSWRRLTARQGGRPVASTATHRRGLDPSALRSLPAVAYNPKDVKDGLECAVCLSEVSEGEKIRLLPRCNHGFHVNCIDMWFHSHSTCPLCRSPVVSPQNPSSNSNDVHEVGVSSNSSESESESDNDHDQSSYASAHSSEEATGFPTNVLIWGNETRVTNAGSSSESSSSLVIDIPREFCEVCSSSPPSEEAKPPVMTSFRSLKRLLSSGKRAVPSPRGSSSADVEQV